MPATRTYTPMLRGYLRSAGVGVATRRQSHCSCPIVKSAVCFAVGWVIVIAFAASGIATPVLGHPYLTANFNPSVITRIARTANVFNA